VLSQFGGLFGVKNCFERALDCSVMIPVFVTAGVMIFVLYHGESMIKVLRSPLLHSTDRCMDGPIAQQQSDAACCMLSRAS
jgi:hypothetical protein